MIARRRQMMFPVEEELYPIGTDIVLMYIGLKPNESGGRKNFIQGYKLDLTNGEYIEGDSDDYASPVFIPVSSAYTYQKGESRLIRWCFYDNDKNFLQAGPTYNNLNVQTLNSFPVNVKYIRIQAYNFANQKIRITRIA